MDIIVVKLIACLFGLLSVSMETKKLLKNETILLSLAVLILLSVYKQ